MEANPRYLLQHISYYLNDWQNCLNDAIDYIKYRINSSDETEVQPFDEVALSKLKLGFIMLPSITYMEDNETSYKLYDAICLLFFNLAQILEDDELMQIVNANMLFAKTRSTIQDLLLVTQSIMIQYQVMNIGNKNTDPYQLSLNYLKTLTSLEDNANE